MSKISSNKRQQLTLFLNECESQEIEKFRKKFNQIQFELIKAHITLCREDEIESLGKIKTNLNALSFKPFSLELGKPVRFSDNNGLLIPIVGNDKEFHELRVRILNGILELPKNQKPHITLLHPRNAICTDEIFEMVNQYNFPPKVKLDKITLIEQTNQESWRVIEEYNL